MELDFRKAPHILTDIVDEMAIGVFTVDAEARFVAWSQGAERITGFPSDEVIGRPCEILEGHNCKGFATLAELLRSETPDMPGICNQECKLMAKNGCELYIHGSVRLLKEPTGDVAGAVGTFTDMTSMFLANEKIALLEQQVAPDHTFEQMIGRSASMREVFRRLKLAADSHVTVLITGESGTGKELAAAAIHAKSGRSHKPLLAVNCSAIPDTLLESELFGHVKGAFTGATQDKLGLLDAADGGTLFLDEIGDVPVATQIKLLRVLQEREIRRVGDSRPHNVDVRLITATNQDLRHQVAEGRLREDFYYRIHVFEIHLPPLRERKEDIPLLVNHFLDVVGDRSPTGVDGVARDALDLMMNYRWPGNIRELRNAIEHACVTVSGDRITYLDLPTEIRHPQADTTQALSDLEQDEREERRRIVDALRQTGGNRTKAAHLLGTSRVTLWKKINRYAIEVGGLGER